MGRATADLMDDYLTMWENGSLPGITESLHPDVDFEAGTVRLTGRGRVAAAFASVLAQLSAFHVRSTFVCGNDAMFASEWMCTPPIGRCRIAELVTFEDGLVKRIELFCDAKAFGHIVKDA
jgi:hypothetical protein